MQTNKKDIFLLVGAFSSVPLFSSEGPITAFPITPALGWQEYEVLLGFGEEMKDWLLEEQHDQCTS